MRSCKRQEVIARSSGRPSMPLCRARRKRVDRGRRTPHGQQINLRLCGAYKALAAQAAPSMVSWIERGRPA